MRHTIMVIGCNGDDCQALVELAGGLPADLALPVVVAMPAVSRGLLRLRPLLAGHCPLPVIEVDDKHTLRAGQVHLAPPGYHLLVEWRRLALSIDPPRQPRPSIDALFDSAVDSYGEGVIAILLGDGVGGQLGLDRVREQGGVALCWPQVDQPGLRLLLAAVDGPDDPWKAAGHA